MVYNAHVVGNVHMLWTLTVMSPEDVVDRQCTHVVDVERQHWGFGRVCRVNIA